MVDWKENTAWLEQILDRLMMKKLVALFDDFDNAIADVMLEAYPYANEQADMAKECWEGFMKDMGPEVREWFNELGSGGNNKDKFFNHK